MPFEPFTHVEHDCLLTRFPVLVLSHLASRRVPIAGISAEPAGPGVPQLMRNATDAEDGFLRHIRVLIHDRDPRFRPAVRDTLPPADVTPLRRPARAPNLNAYTERFVRTIKDSCLERLVLIGEGSRRRAGREFVAHDHHERNHQGLRQSPDPAAVDGPATPWSRLVPPAARWDVARRLSVSSVIHDRPSTPRSSFWTVRGLKSRAPDARDEEHQRLHAKVGELLMENELLYAKVDHLEAGGPLARRRSTR